MAQNYVTSSKWRIKGNKSRAKQAGKTPNPVALVCEVSFSKVPDLHLCCMYHPVLAYICSTLCMHQPLADASHLGCLQHLRNICYICL